MIPVRAAPSPARKRSVLRMTPETFQRADGLLFCRAVQLRERNEGLAVAEGSAFLCTASSLSDTLLAGKGTAYGTGETVFCRYPRRDMIAGVSGRVNAVLSFGTAPDLFAVTDSAVYKIERELATSVSDMVGGKCAAVFHERLFAGGGSTLFYSAPLNAEDFSKEGRAGEIPFPPDAGEMLSIAECGGRLLLFFSKAVYTLRAEALDLAFRLERADFSGGEIERGSVAACNARVFFACTRGIFCTDGAKFERVPCSYPELRFRTGSASGRGIYYRLAVLGERNVIWAYDTVRERDHIVDTAADALAGDGDTVWFLLERRVLSLTDRGFPMYDCVEGRLEGELDLSEGGEPGRVEAVSLEGEGRFSLELQTEFGEVTVEPKGEPTPLPRVLAGRKLRFVLRARTETCALRALTLYRRREG